MTHPTTDLRELLEGMARVPGVANRGVRGLQTDSRRVQPGDLFLALPGMLADGRDYIGDAVASGAGAIAYETDDGYLLRGAPVPAFGVSGLRHKIGVIADRFYGAPSRRLVVVGVTGTNGKTTCTQLLAQALDQPPKRCAVIGTLGSGFPGALNASIHTTPDAVTVQRLLGDYRDLGAAHVAMEVSSHALEQGRVNGVRFHVAVFTNLTRDHLDYHGDMTAYGQAKAKLFAHEGLKYAVINHDDDFGRRLLAGVGAPVACLSYGIEGGDVRAREVRPSSEGLWLRIQTPHGETELRSPLIGHFNVYNLLAVLATLLALGVELRDAAARLTRAQAPAGRAERFGGARGLPLVVVDYAHTPDALEKILTALREHTRGKLWCVFGCGGDRDRGKRPVMGEIAERLADTVLLTDDNPRHESGDAIIADIVGGMRAAPRIIRDRRNAIATAIGGATEGDIVLIAGKGHEDYQQVGDERRPYSDRDTVRTLLGEAA
ncbi:UDP-N-acetylmuramoylalanyl-D-glutamate--2,6-diaminopimelate ligase [Sulfuricaulis limicola]|uniref:UDP-N-acetylmuramoyl-L-alanyl-D-glutamate--2,6-diaminopimelate ligase n=2 Tax=Sulfuricaulis limicola TaxID=1620215 RepID=A0A1B4XDK9_9GAMM|nr:UDP-N-acetylmuramoyl-L-alanyl-D-glutamate--2,6-diaminopimelate ligase [Sulfuricaulis limicola]BAV32868.1 UDP-N-acetylmuramoylalanyl-D-glutamate--2,6-diaminopimelate ligase [Sulfuricaulis limicola]